MSSIISKSSESLEGRLAGTSNFRDVLQEAGVDKISISCEASPRVSKIFLGPIKAKAMAAAPKRGPDEVFSFFKKSHMMLSIAEQGKNCGQQSRCKQQK
jgi:hypothetical protein